MRIWGSYRRFRRYRQIINVLVRNGFGGLLELLRLRRIRRREKYNLANYPSPRATRLRIALTELGPTFIKVGQMLSTRADIVPQDIIQELQKLQDKVPAVPFIHIVSEIESELSSSVGTIFSEFDENPLAAASIGQVHKAKLKTGESVAVKIQRPNIKRVIEEDIGILLNIARLAERYIPETELYNPVGIVNEFARLIRNEMDYTLEARNMERFARNFADDEGVYIPKVYWEYTSGRVLTMELINGIKVSEVDELRKSGFDPVRIAAKGAEAYIKQIFMHGFFHGDPHPGNIFVMPGEI
ncbi:2-polyprenylphenol 6-hydroxylase, partial [Candidatus Poribacteria bacterium]|nr:2-polyprenylphenol 6-hydroxylase [Candidatus Poribacteria bacterium]